MSIINSLGNNFENLSEILDKFESEFKNVTVDLKMKGKALDQLLIEQASLVGYYELRAVELKALRKVIETRVEKVRGRLWKHFTEHHPRELNYRDKENYVNNEESLVELKELFLEVSELEEKYRAACEALKQKGFMLNALVKARVASLDNLFL